MTSESARDVLREAGALAIALGHPNDGPVFAKQSTT
jgi:hypothetical protein